MLEKHSIPQLFVEEESDDENPLPQWLDGDSLAPYQNCSLETALGSLQLAGVTEHDIVYDLGCGDGRICIVASMIFGCRSVGIEKDFFDKCEISFAKLPKNIRDVVTFRQEDVLESNIDDCTVSLSFLLPEGLAQLKEKIENVLRRGGRHVSLLWEIKGWVPMKVYQATASQKSYLYTKESLPDLE